MRSYPAAAHLPRESIRDYLNELTLNCKFKWLPFRLYSRIRAYRYMLRKDRDMGLLRFLVPADRISLDVGANLGLFTYFLARYSREVYAFEPNPLPYNVLKDIVDRNVIVRQMALSNITGQVELQILRTRKGWTQNGARIDAAAAERACLVRVPASRIDDLGLADIGFIKIDVEGHEWAVLEGARNTLARDLPNLFIENEFAHIGARSAQVFRTLQDLGYEGYFLQGGTLTPLTHFSVEQHQIRPRIAGGSIARYVRNFIFLAR